MKKKYQELYEEMLNEIGVKVSRQSYFPEWVEYYFSVCVQASASLLKMRQNYPFTDEQEEIGFFKTLESQFGGLVEYFTLIYTAELFIPEDSSKRMEYWNRELGKAWNFLMKHEKFYLSYKAGLTEDAVNEMTDPGSNGSLAAMIIAREKYMEYIQEKLAALRGRRQNCLLMRA
ncbi:MAG TPA: hypothetical protein VNS58_14705 [Puia sp.]|nr:hypothetical protein [Puia sp.]